MKTFLVWIVLIIPIAGCGSGKGKPDPRAHPNFVDTTDPTNLKMPGGATPAKSSAEKKE